MSSPEKGMSAAQASSKKRGGHINEQHFAKLIGGCVNPVDHTRKQDVHDLTRGWRYSVKSGKKWQIFLYGKNRLETNTILQGIAQISPLMIKCIDTLPKTRDMREKNPTRYKEMLQTPMRKLAKELSKEKILRAFLSKSLFDAGQVEFLAILPSSIDQTTASLNDKKFHVFSAEEVITGLWKGMTVTNSQARGIGQTDAQKVIFRAAIDNKPRNIGEIELRTDNQNYGLVKFWLQSNLVLPMLAEHIPESGNIGRQIILHGKARKIANRK